MLTEIYGMVKSNCTNIKNIREDVKEINKKLDKGVSKMNSNASDIAVLSTTLIGHLKNHKGWVATMGLMMAALGVIFTVVNLYGVR